MRVKISSLKDGIYSLVVRFASKILWLVFFIVFFGGLTYFLLHFSKDDFVDNAMGNLVATVVGVVAGVPIALWITTSQQKAQEEKEAESEYERDKESLDSVLTRVRMELKSNSNTVKLLEEALAHSADPLDRLEELWQWAQSIADAFEFHAYDDFLRLDARKYVMPAVDFKSYIAYRSLKGLTHRVRQAHASCGFLHGLTESEQAGLLGELKFVRDLSSDSLKRVEEALECLRTYEGKYQNLRKAS